MPQIILAGHQPVNAVPGINGLRFFDIGKVLLIGDGVVVGVFHIGDKEIIGGIVGVQRGIKGIGARIGDGADRQPVAPVGRHPAPPAGPDRDNRAPHSPR